MKTKVDHSQFDYSNPSGRRDYLHNCVCKACRKERKRALKQARKLAKRQAKK